jgi:predicted metalloprotease with PDZ domain
MGFPFLKVSAAALAAVTLAFGTLGAVSVSFAQDNATPAATAAAPVATAAAPTTAPVATDAPAATAAATTVAPVATTAATAAAAKQYPACPSTATAAATTAATAVATAAGTVSATNTLPPTATANPSAAYLGVAAQQVQACGAQILDVRPGSGAEAAKLAVNDVVVAVDGQAITSLDQFRTIVQGHKPGDKITITYQRAGAQADAVVTLGAVPADTVATAAATAAK